MEWLLALLPNQLFVIYAIAVMICTGIIKEYNLFAGIYEYISKRFKSKRTIVSLMSAISGVLPIPGRVVVSASLLDTVASKERCKRGKFGLIDYLSTHHYYLWSPLEKTIIIPMTAFGLSYLQMLSFTWPLLVAVLAYTFWYLYGVVQEKDIEVVIPAGKKAPRWVAWPLVLGVVALLFSFQPYIVFPVVTLFYIVYTKTYNLKKIAKYINWGLVIALILIIGVASVLESHAATFTGHLKSFNEANNLTMWESIFILSAISWVISFVLGSSAKFAGIVVILTSLFGIQFLSYFMAVEFSAYLLSPTHKCVAIAKQYFGTSISEFLQIVGTLAFWIILVGLLTVLL